MKTSELRALDKQFGAAFGYSADGRPRYRWLKTGEMFTTLHTRQSAGGIWYPTEQCERINLRTVYGDVWIVAVYRDGSAATDPNPLPAHLKTQSGGGVYTPIDGSQLQRGMEPDADVTSAAIHFIGKHIEKSYRDHLDEANAAASKAQQATKNESDDRIDDAWPAFGNAPGMKAHVSFPPVQKGQECPV